MEDKFDAEKAKHGFMHGVHYWHFLRYLSSYDGPGIIEKSFTASEFFQILHSHRQHTYAESVSLGRFIHHPGHLPSLIHLGKLNGKTPICLAAGSDRYDYELNGYFDYRATFGNLEFPAIHAEAVNYPATQHHPSETTIHPRGDQILRRFRDIGLLMIESQQRRGIWEMTGHVLVIDLDRDRHPWLILAKTWDDTRLEDWEGGGSFTAPDTVTRDDICELGILPDDKKNRTTIARFVPYPSPSKTPVAEAAETASKPKPFLLRFNEDFEFGLERHGDPDPSSEDGPILPTAMSWYRRRDGEHVCVDGERKEYMIREWDTGRYSYPALENKSGEPVAEE